MINDEFDPSPSAPYDSSPSAYQIAQEEVRTNRRLIALEDEVAKLKIELERRNTRVADIGRPIPYCFRNGRP